MTKERIVVETTGRRKNALVSKLELQGESLTDWLEEQISLSIPEVNVVSSDMLNSVARSVDSNNPEDVLSSIHEQDWAFTDDDTGYLTHDLHPYPAKFIPQIPAHLIQMLSNPGDTVFDPFGGSATTAVEAVRLGRRAISTDANPLTCLIGRVKTGFMTPAVRADIDQLSAVVESHLSRLSEAPEGWAKKITASNAEFIPDIPNMEKWFDPQIIAELALIRHLISETTSALSSDAALLALSKIILRVSFQDSETRYVAKAKVIHPGMALSAFRDSLEVIRKRLKKSAQLFKRADVVFVSADARCEILENVSRNSVDLIVTSPPYPNATDYHLYHRFRLFWLGFDPRELGKIEIGSHLKHQRKQSGFEEYADDMTATLKQCFHVMKPGGYAVFVVGDAIFKGEVYSTSEALREIAQEVGFEFVGSVDRPIHNTRRSFSAPARRARTEQLVILRRPLSETTFEISPPEYKMWDYEVLLRKMEIESIVGSKRCDFTSTVNARVAPEHLHRIRKLTFSSAFRTLDDKVAQLTWQRILENGHADARARKEPKYVTHGIHPYKGKFYPQLAKSLMNISGIPDGATLLDPFCGSGTVLLEGMLNGFRAYGCDLHPLAAKIARAKTEILTVDRVVTEHAVRSLISKLERPPASFKANRDQFDASTIDELDRWFPMPVLDKLNWVLTQIRILGDERLVEFLEVIVSSVVRDISQQDPSDLRIRRRKEPIADAQVIEFIHTRMEQQLEKLCKYWSVAGCQPGPRLPAHVIAGDSRKKETYRAAGVASDSVDLVVTSPPYATALPYIDTDRLSLLAIMGIDRRKRSTLENDLTGSREIRKSVRADLETMLMGTEALEELPRGVVNELRAIHEANRKADVGFRRANMASLLWRYFIDMRDNLRALKTVMKSGATAYYVVGDSRTRAGENWRTIRTCDHIFEIASAEGYKCKKLMDISVTTENMKHVKNAITSNEILTFTKH